MITKSLYSLLCLGTIATLISAADLQPVRAASAPASETDSSHSLLEADNTIAQFFPYATPDQQVVMVQGTGKATATAETAEIEFVFVNYDPYYDPYSCYSEPAVPSLGDTTSEPEATEPDELTLPPATCPPPPEPTPLTRSELQPAIAALTQAGIAESDLEVRLPDEAEDYASSYYPGSASISFDLAQPTQQRVQELVTAVEEGVSDVENLYFQDRYVQYTLGEAGCDSLERQAYQAAIADARGRATVLASALEVEIGGVPSVADSIVPTTDPYASSAYPSYCDVEQTSSPYSYSIPSYYDPSIPAEVELRRNVFVTYPVLQR